MANPKHVKLLRKDADEWRLWRLDNPYAVPDLRGADLVGAHLVIADLVGADLSDAHLSGAKLAGAALLRANLRGAALFGADLQRATLVGADLTGANLTGANLTGANLTGADLTDARLGSAEMNCTTFGRTTLTGCQGLGQVQHRGPSFLDPATAAISQLPATFLAGCGWPGHLIESWVTEAGANVPRSAVFISHSSEDSFFALQLHDRLEKGGIRCWTDDHRRPHRDIVEEIHRGPTLRPGVVLCCSGASLTSRWLGGEVRAALVDEHPVAIFPVTLDSCLFEGDAGGDGSRLREWLVADFRGWEEDRATFDAAAERLLQAIVGPQSSVVRPVRVA